MFSVKELIPHSGKMSLLDRVVDYGEDWLNAEVVINFDSMFCDGDKIPALVGIEYMAQAIAAFAGKNDKQLKREISIGLLIGTRKYSTNTDCFPVNSILNIYVKQIYLEDKGLGVFKCQITAKDSDLFLEANLNVFHPENVKELLKK